MSNLIDFITNTGSIVKVANIKYNNVRDLVNQASKCKAIDSIMLFGSSLEERCTVNSDIVIFSKYSLSRLIRLKSYDKFKNSVYNFDWNQEYDWLYFHSLEDIKRNLTKAPIYRELYTKGKFVNISIGCIGVKSMNKRKKLLSADEIVEDILKDLDEESKRILYEAQPDTFGDYAYQFHFTLGMSIRNVYKLWERDDIEPDGFSGIIINKLVKRIKEEGIA